MTDLEDQAAGYLRQIMDLESEVKKTNTLQRQVDSIQKKLDDSEREKTASSDLLKSTTSEVSKLKDTLAAAEKAKKMYMDELKELREQEAVDDIDVGAVEGFDGQAQTSPEQREKTMRLEIEKTRLKTELEKLKKSVAAGGGKAVSQEAAAAFSAQIKALQENLEKKTAENKKIVSDKDKLEAYTKRTLAKFQDKYLVALQECKAKLKEKQDKIELLESRSATEKTAQKREERLLSSTLYELGLSIMQNRLKDR